MHPIPFGGIAKAITIDNVNTPIGIMLNLYLLNKPTPRFKSISPAFSIRTTIQTPPIYNKVLINWFSTIIINSGFNVPVGLEFKAIK